MLGTLAVPLGDVATDRELKMTNQGRKGKGTRMQVPVTGELARRIDELAKVVRRSQRWMATELLSIVIENRQTLLDYLGARLSAWVDLATDAVVEFVLPTPKKSTETVHLDVTVDEKTAAYIQALANQLGHTQSKMAAMMLEWGVRESDFAITLVAGPLLAAQRRLSAITNAVVQKDRRVVA